MNLQDISINKVVLIGRLSRDPELRHTANGTAICQLRVVTTESYVNREGDPGESRASHTVVVWGKKGEDMANRARTNTRVFVEGRIQNRSYENQQGETRWVTEINARTAFTLEDEGNYGQPAPSGGYGQQQSSGYGQQQQGGGYAQQQGGGYGQQQGGGYGQQQGGYTQPSPGAPPPQSPPPVQQPPPAQPPSGPSTSTDASPSTTIVPEDDLPF